MSTAHTATQKLPEPTLYEALLSPAALVVMKDWASEALKKASAT
jgi:hypothetical protein